MAASLLSKILEPEDISSIDFKGLNQSLGISGSWRKIFRLPEKIDFQIVQFSDYKEDIIQYGNGNRLYLEPRFCKVDDTSGISGDAEGKLLGVVVGFELRKSSYATMFMREVLNYTSCFHEQVSLSDAILKLC